MKKGGISRSGVHITLNGYLIEGKPQEIVSVILANIPNLDMYSTWALLHLYKGMTELMMDYMLEIIDNADSTMSKSAAKKYYKKYKNRLEFMPRNILKYDGKERVYRKIYELILEGEDLTNLRGFGFASKFGDSMIGNAETQSAKSRW